MSSKPGVSGTTESLPQVRTRSGRRGRARKRGCRAPLSYLSASFFAPRYVPRKPRAAPPTRPASLRSATQQMQDLKLKNDVAKSGASAAAPREVRSKSAKKAPALLLPLP
eukprot:366501-Chlamydomonas_euryale.AAC.36